MVKFTKVSGRIIKSMDKGTEKFANGDKYEGKYSEDLKNGKGTMEFSNGDIYKGDWIKHSYSRVMVISI